MNRQAPHSDPVRVGAQHAMFWLLAANAVGLLLSLLLLFPQLGSAMGAWSYGRCLPLHLNWQLYGWTSLPLVAWTFHLLPQSRDALGRASCVGIWTWSAVLALGGLHWLSGHTSGKIFLDWTGELRILFPAAILYLWGVLALAWWRDPARSWRGALGLLSLLPVPFSLYFASSPDIYPAVDESTGGPTGSSLLNSTLSVVLLMLVVPKALHIHLRAGIPKRTEHALIVLFVLHLLLGIYSTRLPYSHFHPGQIACLASLFLWIILLPWYYARLDWRSPSRLWRRAMFIWLAILVGNGLTSFLPRILDSIKFSDALVAHSHLAMAGFTSSFLIFLLQQILSPEVAQNLNQKAPFYLWHTAAIGYVITMLVAGYLESTTSSFTIYPAAARDTLYAVRSLCGACMLWVSFRWWKSLTHAAQ